MGNLSYAVNRFVDTVKGRFDSRDQIGFRGRDWNLYRYTQNDPVRYTDPAGTAIVEMYYTLADSEVFGLVNAYHAGVRVIDNCGTSGPNYTEGLHAHCDTGFDRTFGYLHGFCQLYANNGPGMNNPSESPEPITTVIVTDTNSMSYYWTKIMRLNTAFNADDFGYYALYQNSNSYACWLVGALGFVPPAPPYWLPAWCGLKFWDQR